MQTMEIMVCLLWPWDLFLGLEESLLSPGHKSKAGHGEGAMVRVDRKCEGG